MGPQEEHCLEGLIEIVDVQGDAIQQAELPFAVAEIKRPISKTELYATQTSPKREALRIFDSISAVRVLTERAAFGNEGAGWVSRD